MDRSLLFTQPIYHYAKILVAILCFPALKCSIFSPSKSHERSELYTLLLLVFIY